MKACSIMQTLRPGVICAALAAASALATPAGPSALAAGSQAASAVQSRGSGTSGHFRAYAGKPRPPVEVRLVAGESLASGVPGRLMLRVRSAIPLEDLRLDVEGDAGLALTGAPRQSDADPRDSRLPGVAESIRFEVPATPTSGGTRHVSGRVSYRIGGVAQAVPFNVAIEVAGPDTLAAVARKPAKVMVPDAAGELIDSMPAETTIRRLD
jgi:hypothetical protein